MWQCTFRGYEVQVPSESKRNKPKDACRTALRGTVDPPHTHTHPGSSHVRASRMRKWCACGRVGEDVNSVNSRYEYNLKQV